jgi:carboxymethylenebutenolidase
MGKHIQLTAGDGIRIGAYHAEPAGKARGGLVVCQEIFGVNAHIRSVCDGYAADGYSVVAPALFDRVEPGLEIGYTQDDIQRGIALMQKSPLDLAMKDVAAAIDVAARAGKVGIVGYCWGGTVAWAAAARVSGLACSIPYYGGGMAGLAGERPRCPVQYHVGDKDHSIPLSDVDKIRTAHPGVEIHVYPGAAHGFNCDERASFDAESAKLARERALAFLHKHVG